MSLDVPLHDALHEKQAPHSLCGACSLEVPATLIEPETRGPEREACRSSG
jgi:hypothetical protein